MRLTDFESGISIITSPSFFTLIMNTRKINLNPKPKHGKTFSSRISLAGSSAKKSSPTVIIQR
jgi:hypothetical protein